MTDNNNNIRYPQHRISYTR